MADMKPTDSNRPTMEDIAREAGVSTITVSRALAGNSLVKPATRDRIREIAAARGYQLNVAARNLRLKKTRTIAVVIEMIPTTQRPMSDPYPLALLGRSEEHTSELQSLMRISYAVFCLKKKTQ